MPCVICLSIVSAGMEQLKVNLMAKMRFPTFWGFQTLIKNNFKMYYFHVFLHFGSSTYKNVPPGILPMGDFTQDIFVYI